MSPCPIQILHEIPGRVRLRVTGRGGEAVVAVLAGQPGVLRVRLNPGARSLVLDYAPAPHRRDRLLAKVTEALSERYRRSHGVHPAPDPHQVIRGVLDRLVLPLLPPAPRQALAIARTGLSYARGVRAALQDGERADILHALVLSRLVAMGRMDLAAHLSLLMAVSRYLHALRLQRDRV